MLVCVLVSNSLKSFYKTQNNSGFYYPLGLLKSCRHFRIRISEIMTEFIWLPAWLYCNSFKYKSLRAHISYQLSTNSTEHTLTMKYLAVFLASLACAWEQVFFLGLSVCLFQCWWAFGPLAVLEGDSSLRTARTVRVSRPETTAINWSTYDVQELT